MPVRIEAGGVVVAVAKVESPSVGESSLGGRCGQYFPVAGEDPCFRRPKAGTGVDVLMEPCQAPDAPPVEDRGPSIPSAEAFLIHAFLADFLSAVKHESGAVEQQACRQGGESPVRGPAEKR